MIDRALIIDENFTRAVLEGKLPALGSGMMAAEVGLSADRLLQLFRSQLVSRHLDLQARILKEKQQGFYTIGSSGHEGNVVLGEVFRVTDPAFLHYRSGAMVVQRAAKQSKVDIVKAIILSLMASKDDPIACGRHKVFGSVDLTIPPQTSTIASHLPKAVGTALSIIRAKECGIESRFAKDSVVLCSFGDASINHSVAQGALNCAQWIAHGHYPLPLVFVCEDNGLGISVPTPDDWVERNVRSRSDMHYVAADGLNLVEVYGAALQAESIARHQKQPVFLHIKTVRLMGHAGSDVESLYLTPAAIAANEARDPLLYSARLMLEEKLLTAPQIVELYESIRADVAATAEACQGSEGLTSTEAIMDSLVPAKIEDALPPLPNEKQRQQLFQDNLKQLSLKRNMAQQLNLALHDLLLRYKNTLVFGEDVGKKGGVYHVTANLQQHFGPRRVFDTLLDETTILGTAIGFAQNGFIPIPEIQFLAYLHNAEDQLRGEAATLSFFSDGQFTNPMVLRVASYAYQKGFGGHFHNDNSFAVLRDIPGIIIATPSNGDDAAKMLRTLVAKAYQEQRVCVLLEPIALYMVKDLHEAGDNAWSSHYSHPEEQLPFGELGVVGDDADIVILSYGNGFYLSRKAAKLAEAQGVCTKIVDLRWLAPLNEAAIIAEVAGAKGVLIVDECRRTGSISEALVTLLVEQLEELPIIKRVVAEDCFIPLGDAWQHVLPSEDQILRQILALGEGSIQMANG